MSANGEDKAVTEREARLTDEVARLRWALEEAVGPRGSTCTGAEPDMTDAEWTRRQWRNAIDQWKFWHAAYEADIGTPEFIASWRGWREAALHARAENDRLRAALHDAGNFACLTPDDEGEPCACCLHVSDIAREATDG